ncbi:MAG: hypothetical protein IPK52_03090 [Chloroflexi bacterium]|nr:hypothetical protein [Chloroflexota bacterium]
MASHRRLLSPRLFMSLLAVLFGIGLLLSIDAVTMTVSAAVDPNYRPLDQENGTDRSTPAAGENIDPRITFVFTFVLPTATRTPTPINIGNKVWDDLDQDGRQDAGEPGMPGVTVQLWNSGKSNIIDSDITDGSGIYAVIAPTPGNYYVRVVLPNVNDAFSPKNQASGDDLLDSDINPSTNIGFTDLISIASNVISITSIDAGIIKFRTATPTRTPTPVNIGNFVWDDLDQDGRQDAGEPGMTGVVVQLWNSAKSQMLNQASTNASGFYTLIAPTPGNYYVRVVLPNFNDAFSPKNQAGGDDLLDSDINPSTNIGFTDLISIASNVISITTIDAGIIKFRTATPTRTPTPVNIGNKVWNDLDSDGIQDAGEPGLTGIVVQLWTADKVTLLDSDTTDANGIYTVRAPTPGGTYRVRVLKPAGSLFSPDNQGADDNADSDIIDSVISSNFGFTASLTFASNVISVSNIDAGLRSVPATPVPSSTPTKTATPTKTPTPVSGYDTIAVYGKIDNKFSLIDVLGDKPVNTAYTTYLSNAPVKGKFVMGDWNADTQRTPGLFKNGFFWYTNDIGPAATWSNVWIGPFGAHTVVAGRFSAGAANDCIGVIDKEFDSPDDGFPLFYTCELGAINPPGGILEHWLNVELPGPGKYQFIAGDFDIDGLDSIAVRRGNTFTWGNVAPSEGIADFPFVQDFGDPYTGYGLAVSGDWDGDGRDTVGLYFYDDKARFYWRNDQSPTYVLPFRQRLKNKVGTKQNVDSWQEITEVRKENANPLPVPGTPIPQATPYSTPTLMVTLTPTPSYVPDLYQTATPTAASDTSTPLPTQAPTEPFTPTPPATNTAVPTYPPTRTEVLPAASPTLEGSE